MTNRNAEERDENPDRGVAVLWTVYETDGRVHAIADVPQFIPQDELGLGANSTRASLFVGTPDGPTWPVDLPTSVNPTPVSVTYNNGVFEAVFTVASEPAPNAR